VSFLLDLRQRAMLREMGVRVWQPEPEAEPAAARAEALAAAAPAAIESGAAHAHAVRADDLKGSESEAEQGFPARAVPAPLPRQPTVTAPAAAALPSPSVAMSASARRTAGAGSAFWQLGAVHTLYGEADTPDVKTSPAHWLVLLETPAASLQAAGFDPLGGEVGTLLGNMLRAARLPAAARVQLVPLARLLPSTPAQAGLADTLAPLLAGIAPDIVLLMGRLAAQAALTTDEPLGQLRGRVHRLHGLATVLTFDPAHLLRNPDNKAKAWDDLCLAMALANELPESSLSADRP
jgi:uracil-DNA glycosylase